MTAIEELEKLWASELEDAGITDGARVAHSIATRLRTEDRDGKREAFVAGAKFFCDEFAGEYEFWTEHYEAEAKRRYGGEA